MTDLFVIPRIVDRRTLDLWAGSTDPSLATSRIAVRVGDASVTLAPLTPVWDGDAGPVTSTTPIDVELLGLRPDTEYDTFVHVDGAPEERSGYVRTLPVATSSRSGPLRIMLASCFSRLGDDAAGASGLLKFLLSKQALRPHFKVWCGDQVYLDSPSLHYALHLHSTSQLQERHTAHYASTWLDAYGIGASLSEGANVFCADDHELWNNAPFPTPIALDTWFSAKRRNSWRDTARKLYFRFQKAGTAPQIFQAGALSVCVLDTRMDRDTDLETLMAPACLRTVKDWIRDLRGPGILVMGQILFGKAPGRLKGSMFDYALQNYAQFDELAAGLHAAKQSIVVLTGDVHYSRVATTRVPSGAVLAEVTCSPLALVKGPRGSWCPAPDRMRLHDGSVLGGAIATDEAIRSADESVAMLEFSEEGSRFRLRVELWPTRRRNGAYVAAQQTEIFL